MGQKHLNNRDARATLNEMEVKVILIKHSDAQEMLGCAYRIHW